MFWLNDSKNALFRTEWEMWSYEAQVLLWTDHDNIWRRRPKPWTAEEDLTSPQWLQKILQITFDAILVAPIMTPCVQQINLDQKTAFIGSSVCRECQVKNDYGRIWRAQGEEVRKWKVLITRTARVKVLLGPFSQKMSQKIYSCNVYACSWRISSVAGTRRILGFCTAMGTTCNVLEAHRLTHSDHFSEFRREPLAAAPAECARALMW